MIHSERDKLPRKRDQITYFPPWPDSKNREVRWFRPMGQDLQVISNSPLLLEAASTSFGRFGQAQPVETPDFSFRLFAHDEDEGQLRPPVLRMEGSLLYQTTGRGSTLVIDLAGGLAFGYFSATTLANQAYFRWHFLELALFVLLEAQGLMGVHAAALAKKGQAILLRAQSGGGKTTLAYAGARRKYQALAEDVVWLDRARNCWWGMPWSFHLLADSKKLFPELAPYDLILQTNRELKLEVNLETLRPGSTTFSAQPGPVVFVERLPGGPSRLEAISPAQAQGLWPAGRTGWEMRLPHHQAHIEALLAEQPTYRFYFGDDIERGVALLDPLFE